LTDILIGLAVYNNVIQFEKLTFGILMSAAFTVPMAAF
jgi:hypothetical protein